MIIDKNSNDIVPSSQAQSLKIPFEKFAKIKAIITFHLYKDHPTGQKRRTLVDWYLKHHGNITNAEQQENETVVVNEVLNKLSSDHLLNVKADKNDKNEDILILSPNVEF